MNKQLKDLENLDIDDLAGDLADDRPGIEPDLWSLVDKRVWKETMEEMTPNERQKHDAYMTKLKAEDGAGALDSFAEDILRAKEGAPFTNDEQKTAVAAYNTAVYGNAEGKNKENGGDGGADDSGYTFAMVGTAAVCASLLL